jgi:hypothetical protein
MIHFSDASGSSQRQQAIRAKFMTPGRFSCPIYEYRFQGPNVTGEVESGRLMPPHCRPEERRALGLDSTADRFHCSFLASEARRCSEPMDGDLIGVRMLPSGNPYPDAVFQAHLLQAANRGSPVRHPDQVESDESSPAFILASRIEAAVPGAILWPSNSHGPGARPRLPQPVLPRPAGRPRVAPEPGAWFRSAPWR